MPETKRRVPAPVAQARARLAGLVRRHADPEVVEAARQRLAEANAEAAVSKWLPSLGTNGRLGLARIVLSGGDDDG
jgi:hypothetical protein